MCIFKFGGLSMLWNFAATADYSLFFVQISVRGRERKVLRV